MAPWRIVVESCHPRQGPIKINAATTVTNPVLCIEHTLVELERAVLQKNAGRETAFTELIDEYLQPREPTGTRSPLGGYGSRPH